jgi:diguanylate cyclase (GGDEF)-like protein/PAS domain S-box-containing protein
MQLNQPEAKSILDQVSDGVYFVDRERRVTYWNEGAETITGFTSGEVLGTSCGDGILVHVDGNGIPLCDERCPLAATILDGVGRDEKVFLRHKDGHRLLVDVRVSALRNQRDEIVGGIQLFTDRVGEGSFAVQERARRKEGLVDGLTGLPSRLRLERELEALFVQLVLHRVGFGVMLIDVDSFAEFNHSYGRTAGDRVLRTLARTLLASCRPFDVIGRWQGEKFLGLVRNVDAVALATMAERVRALIAASSVMLREERVSVTASVGVTQASQRDSMRSIIQRAANLAGQSKTRGGDRVSTDARFQSAD